MVPQPIGLGNPVHQLLSIGPFRASWNFPSQTEASRAATESTSSQSHSAIDCLALLLRDSAVRRVPEGGISAAPQ